MVDPATHYKEIRKLISLGYYFWYSKITRKYPQEIGVENLNEASANHQILWPFVKAPETINKNITSKNVYNLHIGDKYGFK